MTLPESYKHPISPTLYYEMVLVKAGYFIMGSEEEDAYSDEKPEHVVQLTHDFYIGKYPVTQAIWKAIMDGYNPSYFVGDDRPVEWVSWQDIVEGQQDETVPYSFLDQLHKHASIEQASLKDFTFRLPTEAEWEYAAKGGHLSPAFDPKHPPKAASLYCKYAGANSIKKIAWYSLNSHSETKPVGLLQPNVLGLYDMCGNIEEWCLDSFQVDFYKKESKEEVLINPINLDKNLPRVSRGGAWNNDPQRCRVTYRLDWLPALRDHRIGFRLVLVPSSVASSQGEEN